MDYWVRFKSLAKTEQNNDSSHWNLSANALRHSQSRSFRTFVIFSFSFAFFFCFFFSRHVQTSTTIQIVHHHVTRRYACCPIASVLKMVQPFQATCRAKMSQWWSQSHSTMLSTTTTSTYTRKSSTENAKIQMAVTLKQHTSSRTSIQTIQPFKKLIVKVMKLQFTLFRKFFFSTMGF